MNDLAQKIIQDAKDSYCFSYPALNTFLVLMKAQKSDYSDLNYSRSEDAALVLKGLKNGKTEVALKIIACNDDNVAKIEIMKRGYAFLQSLTYSSYLAAVNTQFFLKNPESNEQIADATYFVQEMELHECRLSDILLQCREGIRSLSERQKEHLAIQMLDAVNLLHQRQIIHRYIRTQNFLVSSCQDSPLQLKLSNLGNLRSQPNHQLSTSQVLPNCLSMEADTNNDGIEYDLFSLGLILLELDNSSTFDSSQISPSDFSQLDQGEKFQNYELNRNSILYKIACKFMNKSIKISEKSAKLMLLEILEKSQENIEIPLFSVIMRSQVEFVSKQLHNMQLNKQQHQKQMYLSQLQSKQDNLKRKVLSGFDCQGQTLTADLLQSALEIMLEWKDFKGEYDLLGIGTNGVVFGVENINENRNTVLKLSLRTSKSDAIRQIEIMKICQTPYIVKFYGYKFFEDAKNNQFVVYELERCKYSLAHHLELQETTKQYSDEQKHLLMLQMMDSVNFLHKNRILHRDIKLDSFLITENESGQNIAKLSHFKHAASLQESQIKFSVQYDDQAKEEYFQDEYIQTLNFFTNKYSRESLLYFAPERWEIYFPTTLETDCYSVGLCLMLLDNYLIFSEEQLARMSTSFCQPYADIYSLFEQDIKVNKTTEISSIAMEFLNFLPQSRYSLNQAINKCTQSCYLFSIQEDYPSLTTFIINKEGQETQLRLPLISKLQNYPLLSKIKLDLQNHTKEEIEQQLPLILLAKLTNLTSLSVILHKHTFLQLGNQSLISPLANLNNLSSLTLDFGHNFLGNIKIELLFTPLANLINLVNLSLYLHDSDLQGKVGRDLLSPLANLINLQNFYLNLSNNFVRNIETLFLLNPLINCKNISTLSVNLDYNIVGTTGAQQLLAPLVNLPNLINLQLDLCQLGIKKKERVGLLVPLANLSLLSTLSLDLSRNFFLNFYVKNLLSPLSNLNNLECLDLNFEFNHFQDDGASNLLDPIANLKNLSRVSLNLSFNYIEELGQSPVLIPLSHLTNITSLSLIIDYNTISTQNLKQNSILFPLMNLIKLTSLTLSLKGNKIQDDQILYLLSPLQNLSNLQNLSLNLNQNQIGSDIVSNLFPILNSFPKLISLSVSLFACLINWIGKLPIVNLTNLFSLNLDLKNNKIGDIDAQSLLCLFFNLNNLSRVSLQLQYNNMAKKIKHLQVYFKHFKYVSLVD